MAKKSSLSLLTRLLFGLVIVLGIVIVFLLYKKFTTPTVSSNPQEAVLQEMTKEISHWYPSAKWTNPTTQSMQTFYGTLSGQSVQVTLSSSKASLDPVESVSNLKEKGFLADRNLEAGGPGGAVWGYKKTDKSSVQLLIFSYKTLPTNSNPNQPLQFDCPCNITMTIFISNPAPLTSFMMANPASTNCQQKGGSLAIQTRGDGGQYGLCNFGDNMSCEEWALFHGECPVGGIKTTGFDTTAQKYCAWLGGKTFAVPNATCTLPNGHVCDDTALFNGTCN